MTQAEIETKAKVAAVDIIEWCCMTEGERDKEDPNFVSDTIAGLMREAYEAGKQEQIDKVNDAVIDLANEIFGDYEQSIIFADKLKQALK